MNDIKTDLKCCMSADVTQCENYTYGKYDIDNAECVNYVMLRDLERIGELESENLDLKENM